MKRRRFGLVVAGLFLALAGQARAQPVPDTASVLMVSGQREIRKSGSMRRLSRACRRPSRSWPTRPATARSVPATLAPRFGPCCKRPTYWIPCGAVNGFNAS